VFELRELFLVAALFLVRECVFLRKKSDDEPSRMKFVSEERVSSKETKILKSGDRSILPRKEEEIHSQKLFSSKTRSCITRLVLV
jgi:hypothetical protein